MTLRPVDRDAVPSSHDFYLVQKVPRSTSSSTSSSSPPSSSAPSASTDGHGVHVPELHLPQGQPGIPNNTVKRTYSPPPTAQKIFSLFPSSPPVIPELEGGPTSRFFQRQERMYFARAGEDEICARLNRDFPLGPSPPAVNVPASAGAPPNWAPMTVPLHWVPISSPRNWAPPPAPVQLLQPQVCWSALTSPAFGIQHLSLAQTPLPRIGSRAPAPDDDDSWKRPTPLNERRRTAKHAKRNGKPY